MDYIHIVKFLQEVVMKRNIPGSLLTHTFLTVLFLVLVTEINSAQQLNRIYEDIGGGSNGTSTTVESNDDYTLYIVGGLLVTGIIVYALLRDNKEKSKKDTTSAFLNDELLENHLTLNDQLLKAKLQIPINISFGMQSNKALVNEKRYFLGMSYNF
jgi:predicted PurR-regulated permease PerM